MKGMVVSIQSLEDIHKKKQISDIEVIVAILKRCRSMTHDTLEKSLTKPNIAPIEHIHAAIVQLEAYQATLEAEI